jgi:phenylalanine-4-hydroxylase
VFCLEDPSPNRIRLDLIRVMRTKYIIDDFQQTYFVIDSFERLLEQCYQDFGPLYDLVAVQRDIDASAIVPGDQTLHIGSHAYFEDKKKQAPAAGDVA